MSSQIPSFPTDTPATGPNPAPLRFELTGDMVAAVKGGSAIAVGVDHDNYTHRVDAVPQATRDSLAEDLAALN